MNRVTVILNKLKPVNSQRDLRKRNKEFSPLPKYFIFSGVELLSLILCIVLDISEYMAAVLMLPVIGDTLDFVGIVVCLLLFQWIGVISFFELVPGADVLPIFIITWLVWYFIKKTKRGRVRSGKKQTRVKTEYLRVRIELQRGISSNIL